MSNKQEIYEEIETLVPEESLIYVSLALLKIKTANLESEIDCLRKEIKECRILVSITHEKRSASKRKRWFFWGKRD